MALKSTIFKAELQISDLDRHYYQTHALTLARHASETDERMMVRLAAFALNADETLAFGAGLSTDDQADLWRHDLTGAITLWIDVGLPDVKLVRRAAGRAAQVIVYTYGRGADVWWTQNRAELNRSANLAVYKLPPETTQALAAMAARNMRLQCMIQDGEASMTDEANSVVIAVQTMKKPGRSN